MFDSVDIDVMGYVIDCVQCSVGSVLVIGFIDFVWYVLDIFVVIYVLDCFDYDFGDVLLFVVDLCQLLVCVLVGIGSYVYVVIELGKVFVMCQ